MHKNISIAIELTESTRKMSFKLIELLKLLPVSMELIFIIISHYLILSSSLVVQSLIKGRLDANDAGAGHCSVRGNRLRVGPVKCGDH